MDIKNQTSFINTFTKSKSKRTVDSITNKYLHANIENPLEKLILEEPIEEKVLTKKSLKVSKRSIFISLISLFICLFIFLLIQLKPVNFIKEQVFNFTKKPYVLTFGEFTSFKEAKNYAIKLLPKIRQITIIEISPRLFSFELERFSSKEKAYKELSHLKENGGSTLHVRYIPLSEE